MVSQAKPKICLGIGAKLRVKVLFQISFLLWCQWSRCDICSFPDQWSLVRMVHIWRHIEAWETPPCLDGSRGGSGTRCRRRQTGPGPWLEVAEAARAAGTTEKVNWIGYTLYRIFSLFLLIITALRQHSYSDCVTYQHIDMQNMAGAYHRRRYDQIPHI